MEFELLKRVFVGLIITWLLLSIPLYQYHERENALLAGSQAPDELVIFNWSFYLDPELIKEFEEQQNIRVKIIYIDDEYHRNLLVGADGSRGVDLVFLDERDVHAYKDKGWLAPVDNQKIPNLVNIDEDWITRYPGLVDFAVPYLWGTTGVIYRSDLLSYPITSWMDILQPDAELQGRIQMLGDPDELVWPAMLALGYDIYSDNLEEYQEAINLIEQQRPYVYRYGVVREVDIDSIVQGIISVAMTYNGDALISMAFDDALKYVVPKEGGTLWMDFVAVMEQSRNKEKAYSFINFINDPKNAARNSEFTRYASANRGAFAYLPEEFLENSVIFPDAETLARCIAQKPLSGWVQYKIDQSLAHLLHESKKLNR